MTIVEKLAEFTAATTCDGLPADVAHETRRIILDSLGCALAAADEPKGTIGLEVARMMGGGAATIIGHAETGSVLGAAFVNGELINALDFDSILPPGHVSPYVIPGALAIAERDGATGGDVVAAVAVAHEMSHRIGKAMDYLRDMKDGMMDTPKVFGYASTVFGATAAILKVRGASAEVTAQGLGIAGSISPVNSHMAWVRHAPSTTIKYTVAGVMAQSALTAAGFAEAGHRGDMQMLDDPVYGYAAMIGSKRWASEKITDALGERWNFVPESSFKPYPHCRVLHSVFDALSDVLEANDIRPGEIERIRVFGEAFVELPIWLNNHIGHVQDAQFSLKHGIALAAQRVKPGKVWQSPDLVFDPAVMALMDKVSHEPHPDYKRLLADHPASRPARVEVSARGQIFTGERRYPKGSPSPDPGSYMSDAELTAKFLHNADGVLTRAAAEDAVDAVMHLEKARDFAPVMRMFAASAKARAAAE